MDSLSKIENQSILIRFLHECVDDLTGQKQINFDSYSGDLQWTVEEFQKTKTSIQKFYRENATNTEYLPVNNLDNALQDILQKCFEVRKSDLSEALIRESFIKSGHNLVKNFDWRLKWIMGCSQMATIRQPILQLDLQYCIGNGDTKSNLSFEMDSKQLDELIHQLESALEGK